MTTENTLPATEPKAEVPVVRRDAVPRLHPVKEAGDSDIQLVELWRIVRKRRALAIKVVVLIFVLDLAYTFLQTPKFRAESTIEFSEVTSDPLTLDERHSAGGDSPAVDYALLQKTQVKALLSDTLALRVIKEAGLEGQLKPARKSVFAALARKHPDESGLALENAPYRRVSALNNFHQNLSVSAVPGTRMINIQFMSPDASTAALVVNTLVKDYKEQYFQNRYAATLETSGWLSKQLDDLRSEIEASQQSLMDYQKQTGILGTDESQNIAMTRLEASAKQLMNAQEDRIVAQTIAQLVRNGNPEAVSLLPGDFTGPNSFMSQPAFSRIQSLRYQQSEAQMEYAEAATQYGAANPKLIELKSRVDKIDEAVQQEIMNLEFRAENNFIAAKRKEAALRAAFEVEKNQANQLNDSAVQYGIRKQEVESSRALYDGLLKKFKEATVLGGLRGSNILVVDEALAPDRPARPIVPLNLALGLMVGLLCAMGSALVAENLDDTITSPDEAEEVSGVQTLGVVPMWKLPGKRDGSQRIAKISGPGTLVLADTRSPTAEAFRTIRTSIIQSIRPGMSTPILFASASSGEGRSTVSLNCAAAFAQQGARVLLVEADMRHPVLSAFLRINQSKGLSSMIQGQSCPDLPYVLPSLSDLSVIPAGPQTFCSSELLGSERMKELIQGWKKEYDYIFFDTPPALSVTDAAALAPACDLVVLIARPKLTRRPVLFRVATLFARLRPRVLGVILNSLETDGTGFSGY